jgi:hypothetical protein
MSRGPTRTGLTQHAGSSRIVPVGLRSREIVRITVRPPLAGGPRAGHPAQTAAFTNPDAVTSPFLPIVFPWTVSAEARDRRPVDARCSTRRTRSTDPVAWTRAGRHEHQPSREQPSSELAEHAAPKRQALPGVRVPPEPTPGFAALGMSGDESGRRAIVQADDSNYACWMLGKNPPRRRVGLSPLQPARRRRRKGPLQRLWGLVISRPRSGRR